MCVCARVGALFSISPTSSTERHLPRRCFVTFKFYRFPLVTSDTLYLANDASPEDMHRRPQLLRRIDEAGSFVGDTAGFTVRASYHEST